MTSVDGAEPQQGHVILVTHGTDGDVRPFVSLGRELVGRGHQVTLLSHAPYEASALAAGLKFTSIDSEDSYLQYQREAQDSLLDYVQNLAGLPDFYRRHGLFDQIAFEADWICERYRPGRTVVVARHTSGISALIAAERCGVPAAWVAVTPSQYVGHALTRHVYDKVLGPDLRALRDRWSLPPVADWDSYLRSARGQLALWPEWFDRAGTRAPEDAVRVGFVRDDGAERGMLPPELRFRLATGERPVLITGGTGQVVHGEFYRVAIAACERAGLHPLVVTRHRAMLPAGPRVRWYPRLPFASLMPHLAAVVHHGGMGTLATALGARIPQVVLAHGVDRPDNAERLRQAGVATSLIGPRWAVDDVADALRVVVTDADYQQRLTALTGGGEDAAGTAADQIDGLFGMDGNVSTPDSLRVRLRNLSSERRRELIARLRAAQR